MPTVAVDPALLTWVSAHVQAFLSAHRPEFVAAIPGPVRRAAFRLAYPLMVDLVPAVVNAIAADVLTRQAALATGAATMPSAAAEVKPTTIATREDGVEDDDDDRDWEDQDDECDDDECDDDECDDDECDDDDPDDECDTAA